MNFGSFYDFGELLDFDFDFCPMTPGPHSELFTPVIYVPIGWPHAVITATWPSVPHTRWISNVFASVNNVAFRTRWIVLRRASESMAFESGMPRSATKYLNDISGY